MCAPILISWLIRSTRGKPREELRPRHRSTWTSLEDRGAQPLSALEQGEARNNCGSAEPIAWSRHAFILNTLAAPIDMDIASIPRQSPARQSIRERKVQ